MVPVAAPPKSPPEVKLLEVILPKLGEAIEVVTGSHSPEQVRHFGAIATQQQFAASRGSDFHGWREGAEPGTLPGLDPALLPVWRDWAL